MCLDENQILRENTRRSGVLTTKCFENAKSLVAPFRKLC